MFAVFVNYKLLLLLRHMRGLQSSAVGTRNPIEFITYCYFNFFLRHEHFAVGSSGSLLNL
jgi:hypothetical protein